MKKYLVMVAGIFAMVLGTCGTAGAWDNMKVTLCHATGSASNPYVEVTVAAPSIVNHGGHGDHDRDIIPPFSWEHGGHYDGLNWNYFTALVLHDHCVVPQLPTTTTTEPPTTSTTTPTTIVIGTPESTVQKPVTQKVAASAARELPKTGYSGGLLVVGIVVGLTGIAFVVGSKKRGDSER